MRYYESTYPGFKVPHAWLRKHKLMNGPGSGLISSRDLCGQGDFTLLTGIGGDKIWSTAVDDVQKHLGVEVRLIGIGWNQEYEDTFFEWREKREVSETGVILVRPDMTVAWRCKNDADERHGKLLGVMKAILSL